MSSLSFEPLISAAAWVTLAVAGVGALAWYVRRRPAACPRGRWFVSSLLMFAALIAVLVILLNPTWLQPIPPPAGKPLLTVLVDSSLSMATNDLEGEQSPRYAGAARVASDVVDELEGRFEVRVRTFSDTTTASSAGELSERAPDGTLSDLATAVGESLEDDVPQGQSLLLLSDGTHNAAGGTTRVLETVRTARSMAAPIYTHTFGGEVRLKDVAINVPHAQELAFVGQSIPVHVQVRQRGLVSDRAELVLEADGEEIDRQEVLLTPDGTSDVQFHVQNDDGGLYQYTVRMEELPSETTSANNTAVFQVRVVRDPIRVLVLEGKPYWDGKFLMRTLAADPSLELDCVVQLTEGRFMRRSLRLAGNAAGDAAVGSADDPGVDAAAPLSREQTTEILNDPRQVFVGNNALQAYQVLVLGRDAEVFLSESAEEQIRDWVSRDGGSLVCYRGSPVANPDQQLSRLLPVRWAPGRESRFRMQVTDRGQSLDWLTPVVGSAADLEKLPSLSTAAVPEGVKPLAVVLGQGESGEQTPILTYQPYGTGRVVAVEGAGMWRWAFLAPEYQQHDPVYGSLWQSLMRWLVSSVGLTPGQDLAFRIDRVSYNVGEPVSAVVLRRPTADEGEPPNVTLTQPGGEQQTLTPVPFGDEPGVYQVYFGRLEAGQYQAVLADDGDATGESRAIAFQVRPYLGEQLDVDARPDLMRRIADESGGAVLDVVEPSAIANQFSEHLARTRPERVRRITAWDRWWVLLSVVGLWASAWAIRRASGLV